MVVSTNHAGCCCDAHYVELVFEEIVSNIIHYGATDGRELNVHVVLEARADEIVLTFDDNGIPFDPTAHRSAPQPSRSLEDARLGGFGLGLARGAASSLNYSRTEQGRNRLTVTLRRHLGDPPPTIGGG